MSYSYGKFNLTATKMEYWHRSAKHSTDECLFCKGNFEKIAEFLSKAGFTILKQGAAFVTIAAVTKYRDEYGGRTDETDYLYRLITAKTEEELKAILDKKPVFDKFDMDKINKLKKEKEVPSPYLNYFLS